MALTLRTHVVVLFVLAILFVTAVATAVAVFQTSREVERSLLDDLARSSQASALGVDRFLDSTERSLTSVAAPIQPEDLRPEVDEERIRELLRPPVEFSGDWRALMLVDGSGRVVVASPDAPRWTNASFAGDEAFEETRSTGRSQLALAPSSEGGPGPRWVVPVPASDGGSETYVLVGVLQVARIEDILFANIGTGNDALLLGPDGALVVTTDPRTDPAAVAAWEDWHALETGEPAAELEGPAGASLLAANADLSDGRGHLLTTTPHARVSTLQAPLVRNALLTAGALAAVTIVLGVWASGSITRPLGELRRTTRRMREGDLAARVQPEGAHEVEELGRDFNAMAEALQAEHDELLRFQAHLEELVEQRTAEVEDKREEMELFFYGVSHDFKSPVTAISSLAQMAEEELRAAEQEGRDVDPAAVEPMVEKIRDASRSLQRLIDELLLFGRAGRVPPNLEQVDVGPLLRGVVDEVRPLAEDRGVALEALGQDVTVRSDPARLERVASNLVRNAVQHMPDDHPDGRVRVSWRLEPGTGVEGTAGGEDGTLVLVVEDNGAGIPKDVQPHLFRPFVHHAAGGGGGEGRGAGTGLGLSVVKQIVESLKGTVSVDSGVGRGTRFTVRLPRDPREADAGRTGRSAPDAHAEAGEGPTADGAAEGSDEEPRGGEVRRG